MRFFDWNQAFTGKVSFTNKATKAAPEIIIDPDTGEETVKEKEPMKVMDTIRTTLSVQGQSVSLDVSICALN